jgi:serine/threonine protein kinase/Tfp pilus assembly protein PilF
MRAEDQAVRTDALEWGSEAFALVERLAEEMTQRWRRGERPLVEEYLARHPALREHPEAALELIAEELHLRQECGEAAGADLARRFPQWRRQVGTLAECHRLLAPELASPALPDAGETLGEFRLLAELGRGAHGRVFLATQPALAERPVVLKLGSDTGIEHLSLARLQHTYIVPLYSAHEFPSRGLRGLCMPWFGGATVAALLEALHELLPAQRTGQDLLQALNASGEAAPVRVAAGGPACQFLARAPYTHVVCWLGACLADALQSAHERGLVHLDLKPSNVLLAADGQPMLLDFHLARTPLRAGEPAPTWLGGTPGYMAPEHEAALEAVRLRQPLPSDVDGRADLYALGVLMYEALAGQAPEPDVQPTSLRRLNPCVPRGLADLLARCLAFDPADRYRTAADLAADLRRHLADLPLRGVGNRCPFERWRKWRRRRPLALPLVCLLLAVVVSGGLLTVHVVRQADKARAALREGEEYLHDHRYAEALDAFRHGADLADDLPGCGDLARQLHERMNRADRGQAAGELHRFCERIRPLFGADQIAPGEAQAVLARCRAVWDERRQIARLLGEETAAGAQVRTDLTDVAILLADLWVRLAAPAARDRARHEALEVLSDAETLLGPGRVLHEERRIHLLALGHAPQAEQQDTREPVSAQEHYALGLGCLRGGDLARAEQAMERALDLEPAALWPNFFKGCCAFRRRRFEDAVLAFSVCVVLAPDSAWCWYNRGLANVELGRAERGLHDFNRALRLDPRLAVAALSRGTLHYRQQRFPEALADLRQALDLGVAPAVVLCNEALVHLALEDREAARGCLRRALSNDPDLVQARELLDRLNPQP